MEIHEWSLPIEWQDGQLGGKCPKCGSRKLQAAEVRYWEAETGVWIEKWKELSHVLCLTCGYKHILPITVER